MEIKTDGTKNEDNEKTKLDANGEVIKIFNITKNCYKWLSVKAELLKTSAANSTRNNRDVESTFTIIKARSHYATATAFFLSSQLDYMVTSGTIHIALVTANLTATWQMNGRCKNDKLKL